MALEIVPLQANHIESAAVLAADNIKALRSRIPLLPERCTHQQVIAEMLASLGERLTGAVALDGGELMGFIGGFYMDDFMGKKAFYSPEWANAAKPLQARRIYEALYTQLAAVWAANEAALHVISLPADAEALIEAFHWLGFGMVAVDGLRTLDPVDGQAVEVSIRKAGTADAALIDTFEHELMDHIAGSPAFMQLEPEEAIDMLKVPGDQFWLAFQDGNAVGLMGLQDDYTLGCAILQDEATVQLEPGYLVPTARGLGVAQALLNRCLAEAKLAGYTRCSVDFEASNVHAQRFWLRYFTPVCFTLVRWVDERLVG